MWQEFGKVAVPPAVMHYSHHISPLASALAFSSTTRCRPRLRLTIMALDSPGAAPNVGGDHAFGNRGQQLLYAR